MEPSQPVASLPPSDALGLSRSDENNAARGERVKQEPSDVNENLQYQHHAACRVKIKRENERRVAERLAQREQQLLREQGRQESIQRARLEEEEQRRQDYQHRTAYREQIKRETEQYAAEKLAQKQQQLRWEQERQESIRRERLREEERRRQEHLRRAQSGQRPTACCFTCRRPSVDRSCGSCEKATYCSRACQRDDWSRHWNQFCSKRLVDPGPAISDAAPESRCQPRGSGTQGPRIVPYPTIDRSRHRIEDEAREETGEASEESDNATDAGAEGTDCEGDGEINDETGMKTDGVGDKDGDGDDTQADGQAENEIVQRLLALPPIDYPPEQRQMTPKALSCKLMSHQRVGLTWLMDQEKGINKGGILADALGLGKTIQALPHTRASSGE
ncbi:Uu.00g025450.m01.CDS01 [Anthostomella pinea]|uniref:Uu.00g025450.m01.CDS01 n=1 Tax=Anthostomella pinea TaxID=933095 RepID=A0AAI8V7W9_9PEZI|nr:Uu.00g025450.m01.CDS01 [Anthostomella pinea]